MDTTTPHRRYLAATLDPTAVREESLEGAPHLVVPVVSLRGDMVITARGATEPEFVPAAAIKESLAEWNGRPVVPDHPARSANDPATTNDMVFGKVFSTTFDGTLHHEAWLNVDRAAELGGLPQQVIDNARAGTPTEVSVGVTVTMEDVAGVVDGQRYAVAWKRITPDHLAIMPHAVGACSMETDVCGMRTAKGESPLRPLIRQLQLSQEAANRQLFQALMSTIPAFLWIEQTFDDHVIFTTETGDFDFKFFRQNYTIADDVVELIGDPIPVTPSDTTFVALTGDDNPPKETPAMCDKDDRAAMIRNLIDSDATKFTDEDTPTLEGLEGSILDKLMPAVEDAKSEDGATSEDTALPPEGSTPTPDVSASPMVEMTQEDYDLMMTAANAYQASQVVEVDTVVAQLRAAKTTFTDDRLRAMSLTDLRTMRDDLVTAQGQTPPPTRTVTYAGYAGRQATAEAPPAPRPYDTTTREVN